MKSRGFVEAGAGGALEIGTGTCLNIRNQARIME
jgi:hypothetical protein